MQGEQFTYREKQGSVLSHTEAQKTEFCTRNYEEIQFQPRRTP